MDYISIESESALRSYLGRFEKKGFHIIALDIEAESNLHVYGEKLCLVQIFDGESRVIIDPLEIGNNALKLLFENPYILKIMYDAGSDLSLLRNSAGIGIKSILDLRPAVELLDYEKRDLHSIIAVELGVSLENKRKYQQYDWTKRPVSTLAVEYALNDVIYLFALKDCILGKLFAERHLETFFLSNLLVQNKDYTRNPEDRYRKINGFRRLQEDKKVIFRKIYNLREKYAKLCDSPPHIVIPKPDLLRIVKEKNFIDVIRFNKRFPVNLRPGLLEELRVAVQAV